MKKIAQRKIKRGRLALLSDGIYRTIAAQPKDEIGCHVYLRSENGTGNFSVGYDEIKKVYQEIK